MKHGSIAGSQVEGRVRERHCSSHGRNSRPVAAALSGQIEGHLDGGEARKSSEVSPRELEEIRLPISQGLICRHLCALLPEGRRWPLGAVQKVTTELEIYQFDRVEEDKEVNAGKPAEDAAPRCPQCSIPMLTRINRPTMEPFWGCRLFPTCKGTLPQTYAGRPTAQVQQEMVEKNGVTPKMNARKAPKKRSPEAGESDSWGVPSMDDLSDQGSGLTNINLTPEELLKILQAREENKN